ncbi:glycoside hydrolase family 5 protein [Robertkochia solimangrovi]|nr:glycoside hydrolase family 5 protein [Robertkochia solimangrovi]
MEITSEAPEWILSSEADWLSFSPESGSDGTTTVKVTVSGNNNAESRAGVIRLTADFASEVTIPVTQNGSFPDYNRDPDAADNTGMNLTAEELAVLMRIGWNLGNTLEATGGETAWGNPMVSEQLIKSVKEAGFNAIRIPCSWDQYVDDPATAKIRETWMDRVKTVVDYCVKNDMYVILNIHWDGGWLENNVTPEKKEINNARQKAYWQQIATAMRDFDQHLLFAGTNEPNVDNEDQMEVLNSYHQTFVDAVRSTGGRNAYRTLIVQGPSTDIEKTKNLMNSLPEDSAENRLMTEIHFYTPYQFCLMTEDADWGNRFYYWGEGYHSNTDSAHNADWGEEETVEDLLKMMYDKYVTNGIPVVLGEYAAIKREGLTGDNLQLHLDSRAYYLKFVTEKAKNYGITPFYWDAGGLGNNSTALFDRNTNSVYDQQALDALMEGIEE